MAATTDVTSSGNDVPIATIVSPTSFSLIPNEVAIEVAESTTICPPITIPATPITNLNMLLKMLISLVDSKASSSCTFSLDTLPFFTDNRLFVGLVIVSDIWKEAGWATIIYFAAISGINAELYEAAAIDGANRWQKIKYIILPGIASAISINLILLLVITSLILL